MKFKVLLGFLLIFLGLFAYLYLIDIPKEKKELEQKEKAGKLFDFPVEQVHEVELFSIKGHFQIRKDSAGQWDVKNLESQNPAAAPVRGDSGVINRVIQELHDLKPIRMIDEKGEDLKSFGFLAPEKGVTLKLKDQSALKLIVGDNGPLTNTLYLKRGDSPKIFLSDAGVRPIVENDLWTLRNKRLLFYDQMLIDRVELKAERESWELVKSGDEWKWADKPAEKVNEEKLSSFLFSAGTLDGEKVLNEEGNNLKEYGLAPPYASLVLHAGAATFTLLIGKTEKGEMVTALGNPAGPVFQINKEFLGKIPSRETLVKKENPPSPATSAGASKTTP